MAGKIKNIRIRLIEDVPVSEAGFRCLLDKEKDFTVMQSVHCEANCRQACNNLLMVLHEGTEYGIECIRKFIVRYPKTAVLVLCMIEDTHLAQRLINMGAQGILCGHANVDMLSTAVREVARGETYIDTNIASAVAGLVESRTGSPFAGLSNREMEITRMMLNGTGQKDIAAHLFISPHTVANHHANIMKKLGMDNHVGLTRLAIRHKIIKV